MGIANRPFPTTLLAVLVLAAAGLLSPIRGADGDADLRRKALALNDVTGDDPIKGEINALLEDRPGTKKLLEAAVKMAKEKNQPFTYNGAFILARTALQMKELESSKVFYEVCAEQASKLQSAQKMLQAYRGLMGVIDLLYLDRKYDRSAKLAQEFLEILEKQGVSPQFRVQVHRQMIRALAKQGKVEDAKKMVETLIKTRAADWRNYELQAWLEGELGHHKESAKLYEQLLDRVAKDTDMEKEERTEVEAEIRLAVVDQLYQDKEFDKSAKAAQDLLGSLDKSGISAGAKAEIQWRVIRALAKQGKAEEALHLVDKLAQTGKGNPWRTQELKARIQRETGHNAEAAKIYEELLVQIPKDGDLEGKDKDGLINDIHYLLSGVYVDMNRVDKAAEHLKHLLSKEPDNPTYNNDLGYIWADHDQNLDEAEKMIKKALEEDRKQRQKRTDLEPSEDRDNAAYLDSMGWVLYKKKKFEEAKKYLLEAIQEKDGQHIEIMDHLADVYMALGNKAEAVSTWKKALELKTETKREEQKKSDVQKKLKAQK